jgi:hypothetical protein
MIRILMQVSPFLGRDFRDSRVAGDLNAGGEPAVPGKTASSISKVNSKDGSGPRALPR